jgi:hypothetical protein
MRGGTFIEIESVLGAGSTRMSDVGAVSEREELSNTMSRRGPYIISSFFDRSVSGGDGLCWLTVPSPEPPGGRRGE